MTSSCIETHAKAARPACRPHYIPSQSHDTARVAVWACQYPYPTLRATGPDSDCDGCPVWQQIKDGRANPYRDRADEIAALERMMGERLPVAVPA